MLKRIPHLIWIAPIILLLLASQMVFPLSGLKGIDARAGELADSTVYLPLVMRDFPPPPPSFGIDFGAIIPENGLNEMVQAGDYWVRRDGVDWASVEPNKGDRNWEVLASLETELLNAQQNGLEPILIVSGTPPWAQEYAGIACGPIKPEELGAFADFMHDLVARYSIPPYNVHYWEIWNEPDVSAQGMLRDGYPDSRFGCWGDWSDAYFGGGAYGDMLVQVSPKIKSADPNAKVLIGGLLLDCDPVNPPSGKSCGQSRFLKGILLAAGGAYFDGISFHAYDFYTGSLGRFSNPNWNSSWDTTGPVVSAKVQYIQSLLDEFGVEDKFLMNTETAIICGGFLDPPGTPPCNSEIDSQFELTKAYYVTEVFTIGRAIGLRASVWYNVFGWRNSGLLYKDLSPRNAYAAYSVAQAAIDGAEFQREIDQFAGAAVYEFDRGNKLIWVLWSEDGQDHPISLTSLPNSAYDSLGNSITPGLSISVGPKPIFLEWNK